VNLDTLRREVLEIEEAIGRWPTATLLTPAHVVALLDVVEAAELHMRGQDEPADLRAALDRLEQLIRLTDSIIPGYGSSKED